MADLKIVVENIWTYVKPQVKLDRELCLEIEDNMSYTIEEYVRNRKAYIPFKFSLFDRDQLRYPTGLFSNLFEIMEKNKISYELSDLRKQPDVNSKLQLHTKKLRDYQEETVEKAIAAERGVIKVATGGGKTVIAAGIIAKLDLKTMFIVNSLDLLEQAYDEFTDMLKVDIGRIGGGYCDIKKINVCTIQTLHSALGLKYAAVDDECFIKEKISKKVLERKDEIKKVIEDSEAVISDECQHSSASSYVKMMKAASSAYYRFGCSATPYRLESTDILLNAYAGKQIVNINASYLIDRGFLVPPKIYFLDPNLLPKYKYLHERFPTIYKEWIVENKLRNNLIIDCVRRLLELDKTILITVTQIQHGNNVMELLNEKVKDVRAEFICGEVDKVKRKELLNDIREKKLKILIGSSVADEGLDLPALDSAIIAGGGKSLIKTLQRVGRTLRPYPNVENNIKKEAIIVDFYDHLRYLTNQSVKRIDIYNQEKRFEVFKHF